MKIEFLCVGLRAIILLIFLPAILAFTTIDIKVEPSFGIGEQVSFSYTLVSDTEEEIVYCASIDCEKSPQAMLEMKTIFLQLGIPITENYQSYVVDSTTQPQDCQAVVSIMEPYEIIETKQFKIIANPDFEFDIFTCKDSECLSKSKIFIQEKTIFLNYNSEVENPTITATLISPDKTTKPLTLPTSIKANQIGTYTLGVTASKEGYQSIQVSTDFGVIKNSAEIDIEQIACNNNLICENGENSQNCPQDCPFQKDNEDKPTGELPWLWIAIIVVIVAGAGLLIFLKK